MSSDQRTQLAAVTYTSARDEMRTRIDLRDQVAVLFLGASSTIVAVVIGPKMSAGVLALAILVIWLLSAGALSLFLQHNEVIGSIGHYLKTEWNAANPVAVSHWDGSRELVKNKSIGRYRKLAPLLLIVTPSGMISAGLSLLGRSRYHAHAWRYALASCVLATALELFLVLNTEKKRNAKITSDSTSSSTGGRGDRRRKRQAHKGK